MRGYGLPRNTEVAAPDVGDIKAYGMSGSTGHLRGKGGDFRSFFKNPFAKRRTRRYWKRVERAAGRRACVEGV